MTPSQSPAAGDLRGRVRLLLWLLAGKLLVGAGLRVLLYARFHDGPAHPGRLLYALFAGPLGDVPVGFLALLPFALAIALAPAGLLNRTGARVAMATLLYAPLLFYCAVEYFFFDEFSARFNHIALDYVTAPDEVVGNVWQSYNVPLYAAAALAGGLALAGLYARATRGARAAPLHWRGRAGALGRLALAGALAAGACALPPARYPGIDRITDEIAHNGFARLVRAFRTADLQYDLYYPVLPRDEAHARAAAMLGLPAPPEGTPAGGFSPERPFGADAPGGPYDVVVILEESFGSEFVGVLGHPERHTSPGFDRWSREGLLLTRLVPTGNRTVRGLEAVLASFPPLPGDSTVKRDRSEDVATLARVFRRAGYDTAFYYGGWGVFDNMKPYMLANGYERFVERDAFPKDAFSTIWGVADEYALGRMLEDQRAASRSGRRHFYTLLSVSNHKPYRVPDRPAGVPAARRNRDAAVAYSDWALADYLDKAKAAGLLSHTVVLVVGDHGARVYGAQEIPTASYRIPALFLSPDPRWKGVRHEGLCSQIDLGPTLLALAGVKGTAPFFGNDLTASAAPAERAFLIHNRDIAYMTPTAMVALGLNHDVTFYRRPGPDSDDFEPLPLEALTPGDLEMEKNATAIFQLANELYLNRKYRLPEE